MAGTEEDRLPKILIGWAARDVTPDKPVELFGQFNVRISKYVNDPLITTALALESDDGSEQGIMVSLDAAGIQDSIRDQCRAKLAGLIPDFDSQKFFINATHTHTAPSQPQAVLVYPPQAPEVMTPDEYGRVLVKGISEAASEAWRKRRPGGISWGCGQAVVGFNRRAVYLDGSAKMYGNTDDENFSHLEGHEDHGVEMLFTYDTKQKLTGMIINLACPSQVTEGASFVSADFWHETRNEIRKRHGRELFIFPQCSAAGDQSPHLMLKKRAEARMLTLKGLTPDENGRGMAERAEIANRIARAVDEVLPLAAKDIHDRIVFKHKVTVLNLPRRIVTEEDLRFVREQAELHRKMLPEGNQDPASVDFSRNFARIGYFQKVVDRYEEQKASPTLPTEIHIIRLGDTAFASNQFEYFLDYGQRIKARSKAVQIFIVQLAGEGPYLPTRRAVTAKSYGAGIESSLVGPEGGQLIVNESVRLINELFSGCGKATNPVL
ncbi:MAG: hypothetical protein ABIK20_04690 [Candidatus Omnitrophota bacterium]